MFGGGVWPVVQRELRETARWPLGPWLRMGGALGGVFVFSSVAVNRPMSEVGAQLFSRIHLFLLCLICGLVPALTADCIARERREGTLGLLFMTPLTASGIVLGKVLAQVLRSLTLWLAVLPLLTIPFLYGGVTWTDVAGFFLIELCAGMLSLAAGVLASSLTENRAVAFILAFLLMGAFVREASQFRNWSTGAPMPGPMRMRYVSVVAGNGGVLYFPASGIPRRAASSTGLAPRSLPVRILTENLPIAALILFAALRFAGWCVERSWQDKIPSVRREGWIRRYCMPRFFDRSFAGAMRRTLERNPIAWLQQYSWKARLSKWGLCLLFVVLECSVIDGNDLEAVSRLLSALVLILAAAYTFAGVNGFLQDKKSGALELILVSPITVNQIIFGRVWGLWKQFLPSALVLVGSDITYRIMIGQNSFYGGEGPWMWLNDLEIVAIFLTLPVVATCFALSSKNLFVASALTAAIIFGPAAILFFPEVLFAGFRSLYLQSWLDKDFHVQLVLLALPCVVYAVQVCSARLAYTHLQRSLGRRSYAY
jgi:ABC-type Na+ efflux pump permease subunit